MNIEKITNRKENRMQVTPMRYEIAFCFPSAFSGFFFHSSALAKLLIPPIFIG